MYDSMVSDDQSDQITTINLCILFVYLALLSELELVIRNVFLSKLFWWMIKLLKNEHAYFQDMNLNQHISWVRDVRP